MSKTAQTTAYGAVPTSKPTDANYDIEIGDVVLGDTDVGLSGSQSQKMLHVGFVRKVYGILSCQLLLTGAISSVPNRLFSVQLLPSFCLTDSIDFGSMKVFMYSTG